MFPPWAVVERGCSLSRSQLSPSRAAAGMSAGGLGGYAPTHFTGKSGSRSAHTPPLIQPFVGVVFFPPIIVSFTLHLTTHAVAEEAGSSCCEGQTAAESRIFSTLNISSGPATYSQARYLGALLVRLLLPPLPRLEDLGRSLWHLEDATLEGEGVGGRWSSFFLFCFFF